MSVEERSVTQMVGNREWDHLHAEDTSTDIQNLTITIIVFPPAAPRSITIFSAQFKLSFLKQAFSSLP